MKLPVFLAIAGFIATAFAGTMVVHQSDGTVSRIALSDIQKITFDLSGGILPAPALQRKVRMALADIFPNPFNPSAAIEYTLDEPGRVRVRILDARGVLVRAMEDGLKEAGSYRIRWDGRNADGVPLPSGVYVIRLQAGAESITRKAVVQR